MPTFIEEVLKRNAARLDIDPALQSQISGEIRRLHSQALARLDALKAFTDPATGKFIDTTAARFAAEATAAEMESLARASYLNLGSTLSDLKAGEFKHGLEDVSHALEASRGIHTKLGGSMSQVFKEAGEAAAKRPVLGLGPKTSWDGLSADTQRNYRATFTKAVINGESIPATAEKLRGIEDLNRVQSLRIARTNMTAAQNDGQRAMYEANPDIYIGYRWEATLDNRTSAICAMLHGSFYPLGSTPPGPPAHPNCRCVLVGVPKDEAVREELESSERRARILDKEGEAVNPDTGRLYGTELLSAEKTNEYSKWLKGEAPEVSDRVLGGKVKGSLFRANKVKLDDIVGPDLRMRSNREVIQRAVARNPADDTLRGMARRFGIDPNAVDMDDVLKGDLARIKDAKYTLGTRADMDPAYRAQIEQVQARRTVSRETARVARDTAQQEARRIKAEQEEQRATVLPANWSHLDLESAGLTNAEQRALRKPLNEIAGGWKSALREGNAQLRNRELSFAQGATSFRRGTGFESLGKKQLEEMKDAMRLLKANAASPSVQRIAAKLEVESYRAGKELAKLGITDVSIEAALTGGNSEQALTGMMKTIREGLKASAAQGAQETMIADTLRRYDKGIQQALSSSTLREGERIALREYRSTGRKALEETLRMADGELLKNVDFRHVEWNFEPGRSNAPFRAVYMDTMPGAQATRERIMGDYARGTVPHEFTHHLEREAAEGTAGLNSKVERHKQSMKQLQKGNLPQYGDMKISDDVEAAYKGVMWNDYAAKEYDGDKVSEMVTMGVQALFDKNYFLGMANSESGRRHLRFTYAFMRGRLNKKL